MRRALITGGSGFVGQWLIRDLLRRDMTVFAGTVTGMPIPGVLTREEITAVNWLDLNVLADKDVSAALRTAQPEWVIHLAGMAFPPEAAASPLRALDTNALGALRMLDALLTAPPQRVLIVGSAEEYGTRLAEEVPIRETAPVQPRTIYAASKACQELIALTYFRAAQLPVICTRSFNHSGRGQPQSYLLPQLVERTQAIRAAGGSLRIGNGSPVRDFLHVADVVRAYVLLLERGVPGEVYNVCSGHGTSVADLAARVLKRAGVTADISQDPALMRPVDTPILVGDNSKLRTATGWTAEHTTDDIIDDLLHATTH